MASGHDKDSRRRRVAVARAALIACTLGWPATSAWVWFYMGKFSPFEQVMLFLSWVAPAVSAADFLTTAQVHQEQAEGPRPGGRNG